MYCRSGSFTFGGKEFPLVLANPLFAGPPGPSMTSERCLELGFARVYLEASWFKDGQRHYKHPNASVLEIGAVTPYYWEPNHAVIDIADTVPSAVHVNVFDILDFKGKHVLSISTFEHVSPVERSVDTILKIMAEAESYLITVPIGEFPHFDRMMRIKGLAARSDLIIYHKTKIDDEVWEWEEMDEGSPYEGTYMTPFMYANTVAVFASKGW